MKNKGEQLQTEELTTVRELIDKWITTGTALTCSEGPIMFNSKLSPVKFPQVQISSTEASNQRILHKLHAKTRSN